MCINPFEFVCVVSVLWFCVFGLCKPWKAYLLLNKEETKQLPADSSITNDKLMDYDMLSGISLAKG